MFSFLSLAASTISILPLLALASPSPPPPSSGLQSRQLPVTFGPVSVFVTPSESLEGVSIVFPQGQAQLVLPKDEKLVQYTVGRGFQNYTCSSEGKYVSAGAVADLSHPHRSFLVSSLSYDISPWSHLPGYELFLSPFFLKEIPFPSSRGDPKFSPVGSHFFISKDGGISPEFEFREALKDESKFVVGRRTGGIDDPVDSKKNIQWLQFTSVEGALTKTFFRHNTAGGQPPASCNSADKSVLSVPYATLYSFFY
ncbi:hypothetical protein BDY24DRAFT_435642 [Mrakia frigida]|uniref:uncharacterized protein n=1 Tax=Mrakia frigida TaxID=29902 RepID=UPI003FCC06DE